MPCLSNAEAFIQLCENHTIKVITKNSEQQITDVDQSIFERLGTYLGWESEYELLNCNVIVKGGVYVLEFTAKELTFGTVVQYENGLDVTLEVHNFYEYLIVSKHSKNFSSNHLIKCNNNIGTCFLVFAEKMRKLIGQGYSYDGAYFSTAKQTTSFVFAKRLNNSPG